MPLHDWTDRQGWDGVHHLWIVELLRCIKPQLPAGYRAYIGTMPTLTVGAPTERPDVGVLQWTVEPVPSTPTGNGRSAADALSDEPIEEVAVATLDPATSLFVELKGNLIAAVELISPRNKDRLASQNRYLTRYVGYLMNGIHLLLVDVHRLPLNFSFAARLAQELQMERLEFPAPFAISYRVGEPAPNGGRFLAKWPYVLKVNEPLPSVPLALTVHTRVLVDLEATYRRAAEDAYLS